MMRLLRTSAFRLTLRYVALFGAALLILFLVLSAVMRDFAEEQFDRAIDAEIALLRTEAAEPGSGDLAQRIVVHQGYSKKMRMYYLLQAADGQPLAGNMAPAEPKQGRFWRDLPRAAKPWKLRQIRLKGQVLPDGSYLLVGQDPKAQEQLEDLREALEEAFLIAAVAVLLMTLAGGAVVSAGLLRRVETVSSTSRRIVEGNLSERLPVRGNNDEFDHLAQSLNVMLDRMQRYVESIQQVSTDIAHDLRTPLTRLRHRLERARDNPDAAGSGQALEHAIEETDRILGTFGALLRIAQVEADARKERFVPVDLSELLTTMAEVYLPAFEERSQTLVADVPEGLSIDGDRELLGQMVANLIENAGRHSPPDATIRITAADQGDSVELCIADNGPGIPPDERERVFRRFYRLESSRTTPGNGLGLSLVAAVAQMHGATVQLGDNGPGLAVTVRLAKRRGPAAG